jgi:hypothetical protein
MNRLGVTLCALLVAVGCSSDRPATEADLRGEIQVIYDEIARAVERKDIAGVSQFSLPTATVRFADGTELTLPEWTERAKKGWTNIKSARSKIVVDSASLLAKLATADYTETHEMTIADPGDGADHDIHYESQWRATLERSPSGWRIKRSIELKRHVTQDGKVIDEQPK